MRGAVCDAMHVAAGTGPGTGTVLRTWLMEDARRGGQVKGKRSGSARGAAGDPNDLSQVLQMMSTAQPQACLLSAVLRGCPRLEGRSCAPKRGCTSRPQQWGLTGYMKVCSCCSVRPRRGISLSR